MSQVFVDTSALYALLVRSDERHGEARRAFVRLKSDEAVLVTSSYVLVETYALLGRRIGLGAVAAFRDGFAPLLDVAWVDPATHDAAVDALVERGSRELSLVDLVSFGVMRARGIDQAFAFDRHFKDEGFATRS
jgi:uncharacterized protein